MYEDKVKGRITDVRFTSLADSYEQEENQIRSNIQEWQAELDIISDTKEQTKLFADSVKKYTNIKELTAPILNELIEKIVVYDAEPIDGVRTQKIEIFYRFIGLVN